MSFNDYVKFITEQVVLKLDQPRHKEEKKDELQKAPFMNRAFGMIPFGISMFVQKKKNDK
ncbi:YqzE family protein [Alkalihalobacillus trypoxylicola]|uniref:YqzE family protein n=1 Tax=Alkalihalobacillus trypoxylicola TaxID=519424 RepID=A0A161Q4D2_9BACI|nr:YqzE family protein [Alkalihalobacillus trypoxylicola]KYG30983.1 hypothetical protein AZF04_18475 [Alkalihalobacillus trypoxylicola]